MGLSLRMRARLLGTALGFSRPAPLRSAYAGAQMSRLTLDWYASLLSADKEIKSSLRTLRARSRQLIRDNPHASAFINLVATNVIGPHGIRLQSRIAKGSGDLRGNTNAAIEAAWQEWGEPGTCDVTGRLDWVEVQNLYISTMAADGEVLIRRRQGYDNAFGFALQFLDIDQLDEMLDRPGGNGANEIRMGVEINGDGRPLFYHLFDGHPADLSTRQKPRLRVPADQIIHDFLTFRPGQTRGVPWMAPVLFRLNMLDGYEGNELIASRASAAKPVYFETDPEHADFYGDIEKPTEPLVMEFSAGTSTQLPPGLKAVQMNPTHPTTAFSPFQKSILRAIAVGCHVSYNSLTNDLESVNYSSIRAGLLQERDGWRGLQTRTACHFCTPVFRPWLKWAATSGAVVLPSLDVRRWSAPTWQPRGWAWVDPTNDIQAAEMEVKLGINTRTAICAERGRDYEEVVIALEEEQAIADAHDVDVSGSKPSGQAQLDAQEQAANAAPPAEDPALAAIAASTRETTAAVKWIAGKEYPAPVIQVDARTTIEPTQVTVEPAAMHVTVALPKPGARTTEVLRDDEGQIIGTVSTESEA